MAASSVAAAAQARGLQLTSQGDTGAGYEAL
jgi:hypothetical protein